MYQVSRGSFLLSWLETAFSNKNTDGDITGWSFVWMEEWDPAVDATAILMEGGNWIFLRFT